MGKHILLIAVSTDELAIDTMEESPAIANVTALRKALLVDLEGLRDDQIITLINPNLRQMRHAIALMTYRCRHDDLCLIYYTGYGVLDPRTGAIYLPASDTDPHAVATTAISSDYIRQALPSLQEGLNRVMILDCLWSSLPQSNIDNPTMLQGGMSPKGHLPMPHLADCNCALLTALASSANPWPTVDLGLSLYTHYLIEGITTGLADTDADGGISIDDLQTYLARVLSESHTDIFPIALYTHNETADTPLLAVPPYSPEREYRRSLEEYAHRHQGHISPASRNILEFLRHQLGISIYQSQEIEANVMAPYAHHKDSCDRYRQAMLAALELENPLGKPLKKWLQHLQSELALSYEDVCTIEAQAMTHPGSPGHLQTLPRWLTPIDDQQPKLPAHVPNGRNGQDYYNS
ncbi:hypothetical protein Lepto7375DRAFT_2944 [Leptolyngbya sp. PCC 7375]|nr:hypothetical protein Lepto7375DRAFT_2944 [Leptolyngbya sp. PCC 7375]